MTSVPRQSSHRLRGGLVLLVGLFLIWAIYDHRFGLNDTKYFAWNWRHVPAADLYPALLLAIPFFTAQWIHNKHPARVALPLAMVMLSSLLLMLGFAYLQQQPHNWQAIAAMIQNPADNGYIREAAKLTASGKSIPTILRDYPEYLTTAVGHVYNKPPGLLLLSIAFLRMFGGDYDTASQACGIFIAVLAALSVGAAYIFIRYFTANRDVAFFGASYMALCPGLLLYFPQFDQCYPLCTVALTICWAVALQKNKLTMSALFGLLFTATLFVTYLPATLVIFFAGIALLAKRTNPSLTASRVAAHIAISVASFAAFYFLLWAGTGFNVVATYHAAASQEHERLARYFAAGNPSRNMPGIIPWNFYNFAVGSGWMSYLLALFYFLSKAGTSRRAIAWLCIIQIFIVGLSGLIGPETWRLWLFLLPMLMVPLGLELAKWNFRLRLAVYAILLALTTVMCQSLLFMF